MKNTPCLLAAALLLAGCVHGDNVERLQAGMDREQVRAVMGPERFDRIPRHGVAPITRFVVGRLEPHAWS